MFLKQQLWEKNAKPSWNGKTYGNPWKKPLKASKSIADAVVKPSQKPMAAASLTTILASLSWGMWECRLPPPWCGCSLSGTRKSWGRPVFFFSVRRLAAPPWSEYVLYIYDNMYIYILFIIIHILMILMRNQHAESTKRELTKKWYGSKLGIQFKMVNSKI